MPNELPATDDLGNAIHYHVETENDILHMRRNSYHVEENERLVERLIWYADKRHVILLHNNQYLATYNLSKIVNMRRVT